MPRVVTNAEWTVTRLGDIAEFRNGVNYNRDSFGEGGKVVGVKDFKDYSKPKFDALEQINPEGVVTAKSILRDGDIIFVRSNGNRELSGRSLFIERPLEEITHSAFTIRLQFISEKVCPKFYAYLFRAPHIRKGLTAFGGETNISNLNQSILGNLEVPLPPIPVQKRITEVLSAYDELIENNQRRIRILEDMVCSLYREWFVYFRYPGHEAAPLVDSPLGPIPQGWEVRLLKEVCVLTMWQSPKSEFYNGSGDGLPFHQGVTDFGARFPSDRLYCTVENRLAEAGDILFSVRAPVGRMNIANKRIVIGRGLSDIRHSQGHQVFLWQQLKEKFYKEDLMGNGAIFASVTKVDMQNIKLLCPSEEIIRLAARHIETMHGEIECLAKKVHNLMSTRDLLLPKLMSGEIDSLSGEEGL